MSVHCPFVLWGPAVLVECAFHERENVIESLCIGGIERSKLEASAVNTQFAQHFDNRAGFGFLLRIIYQAFALTGAAT